VTESTGVNTVAVGLITRAQQAEQILASGQADQVALARHRRCAAVLLAGAAA
jgi:2,4-dienoyl-CoA reductase-like NADH-dependent reductase (Old Yellow Enzyme family)